MSYGYQDSSEVGPGKQGGKFGLNVGALVSKFEYNANAGKDGAAADAIDFTVQVGEKEYMHRFFPVNKVYDAKSGNELTDVNSEAYKAEHKKAVTIFNGTLSDIVKCFASEEDLKQALATPISSFKDYAQILERLVKTNGNWNKQPVDVFLEYQYKPTGENKRTFLTLPKNVKQGSYIVRSAPGVTYTEDRTATHVKYIASDGTTHPFKRGEWYISSPYANATILGDSAESTNMNASTGAATESNW